MAENLRVTRDAGGNNITRYCYANNSINCELYGGLYSWFTVMNGHSGSNISPSGVQGLCPAGWHVPSDAEWMELLDFLHSQGFPNTYVPKGAGNALKSCRQVGSPLGGGCDTSEHPRWNSHDTNYGFDEFGFLAMPGGYRYSTVFWAIGSRGQWWSTTEGTSGYARAWRLANEVSILIHSHNMKDDVYSLRCIKD